MLPAGFLHHMNFRLLGWICVALAVLAALPYLLRTINKWTFKSKNKKFLKLINKLRPVHRAAGILLVLVSAYHGYLALYGRLRLHTGTLVFLAFLITTCFGVWHYYKKNKQVFKGHKFLALLSFTLLALHLIKPWALGQIFGIW